MFDYSQRIKRFQNFMSDRGVDAALLTAGSDLPYFSGYTAMPLERITALVVPSEGSPALFVPRLEAPRVKPGDFEIIPWDETDEPIGMIGQRLNGAQKIAVGDTTWSAFLLEFQSHLPAAEWTLASDLTRELRMRKEPEELAHLRAAAEATDRVIARIPDEVRFAGRSELEVAKDFTRLTVEEGHDMAMFTIIASGPNSASPHHETGNRLIQEGDMVVCDFGGTVSGYHSDVTRTFVVGEPTVRQREIHDVVRASNQAGRDTIAPGVACSEVDRVARAVIEDAGYGEYFIHRTGHGIGLDGHEHPYIVAGNDQQLEEGMTFSIEPGIYIPGEFGVRIEDIVACDGVGIDDLNKAPRALTVVA